jgi:hypothetical protein
LRGEIPALVNSVMRFLNMLRSVRLPITGPCLAICGAAK